MTAFADVVSPEARALLERARELAELDQLIRRIPEQRPPQAPPPLAELAARSTTTTERTTTP
jgi:hypothetical protein